MVGGWSIRHKLLSSNLLVSLTLLLATLIITLQMAVNLTRQESEKQFHQIISVLEQDLIRALVFSKPDQISDLVRKLQHFTSLEHLFLYRNDGTPVLAYHRDPKHQEATPLLQSKVAVQRYQGNLLIALEPLQFEQHVYGTARLELQLPDPALFMHQFVPLIIWLVPLLLVLSVLMAWWLQQPITRPLEWLTNTVHKMARNQDFNTPIPRHESNEIGRLFAGVHELAQMIRQSQEQLKLKVNQLQQVLDHINDIIVEFGEYGQIITINQAGLELLQPKAGGTLSLNDMYLLTRHDTEPLDLLTLAKTTVKPRQMTGLTLITAQTEMEAEIYLVPAPTLNSRNRHLLIIHLLSDDQSLQNELEKQAVTDRLTGLANRMELERQLAQALKMRVEFFLMHLDIDRFKLVNETLSFSEGDQLLIELANLLKAHMPDGAYLARIGGDEFAILFPDANRDHIHQFSGKLLDAIRDCESLQSRTNLPITVSIGIADSREVRDLSELLKNADASRQMAKQQGGNRYHVYRTLDEQLIQHKEELTLYTRVIDALNNQQITLYFQRIQPLQPKQPERLHFETLARIQCSEGKLLPPGLFMPVAERYQLAVEVDIQVIQGVFQWFQQQPELLDELELVNINLSGSSLGNEKLERVILGLLETGPLQGHQLCFELTETSAIRNPSATHALMQKLKAHGCLFSLDDFGTGMSSLAYLKQFPVDFLKLDGSFIRELETDPTNQALVRIFANIGKVFGMKTVAEFVETPAIHAFLEAYDIDYAQGYAIHKPEPFARMIQTSGPH